MEQSDWHAAVAEDDDAASAATYCKDAAAFE